MFRHVALGVVAMLILGVFAGPGFTSYHGADPEPADDAAVEQIETAIFHAGELAQLEGYSGAITHLGHALNCLEGAGGDNFNPGWGHPCDGMGDGAVNDLDGLPNEEAVRVLVEAANTLAVAGVNAETVEAVHSAARGVVLLLEQALAEKEG